jgi:hypothetical protein
MIYFFFIPELKEKPIIGQMRADRHMFFFPSKMLPVASQTVGYPKDFRFRQFYI